MTDRLAVVIMAAGKGTRMKSDLPKVLLLLNDRPLLEHVLRTAQKLNPKKIIVVVGHKRELVEARYGDFPHISFVTQEPQLGTGHAVAQAEELLRDFEGEILVLSGDVPLISEETLRRMCGAHTEAEALVTVLSCHVADPASYGRIVRKEGAVVANVEAKDATPAQLAVTEINAGIYLFNSSFLFEALAGLSSDNAQGEYYLPDLIAAAREWGGEVVGVVTDDPTEMAGANTPDDLRLLSQRLGARGG